MLSKLIKITILSILMASCQGPYLPGSDISIPSVNLIPSVGIPKEKLLPFNADLKNDPIPGIKDVFWFGAENELDNDMLNNTYKHYAPFKDTWQVAYASQAPVDFGFSSTMPEPYEGNVMPQTIN